MIKNILVTGGSRGIGLEFTRQYLKMGHRVFTASRFPDKSNGLQDLKLAFKDRLFIYQLDVSVENSRDRLFQQVSSNVGHLDILINNAGIASGNEKRRYPYGKLDQDDLCRCLLVNSVAQLMMTERFTPLLKNCGKSVVVNISSNSGSITLKKGGGDTGYGYSASKAALNMMTKMISHELRDDGIIVVSFHPGWVRTTMLYCENAPIDPVDSISGMIQVIDSLSLEDSGKFLDWKGNELPW